MNYLKATNLTKSYSDKKLVDHVDFVIDKWQKIALVARNGAGKTTLIRLITGEIDKTDGNVEFRKWIRIWVLSQDMKLDWDKKVIDELFANQYNESLQIIKKYEQILADPNFDQDKLNDV